MTNDFTKFEAWKNAMFLAKAIHNATASFPKREMYSLTDQMRRASVSVAANIAEGFGRYTYADKMHKYVQARGELIEVMTFLHHATQVKYLTAAVCDELLVRCVEIHKLLNALISTMQKRKRLSLSPNP